MMVLTAMGTSGFGVFSVLMEGSKNQLEVIANFAADPDKFILYSSLQNGERSESITQVWAPLIKFNPMAALTIMSHPL